MSHSEFLALTGNRYYAMQDRVTEKRSSAGHVIRVGRQLGFTCDEYRQWLREQLGGEMGTCRCFYCTAVLSIQTVIVDHMTPLSQGGALTLDNLAPACCLCNDQKGEMRAQAYMQLRSLCMNRTVFSQTDCDSCLGRLQSALKLAIRAQKARKPAVRVLPHIRNAS